MHNKPAPTIVELNWKAARARTLINLKDWIKTPTKSEFVQRQRALNARIKMVTLWPPTAGTYVRSKHGRLR